MIEYLYFLISFLLISNMMVSQIRATHWLIRFADFPRIQLFVLGLAGICLGIFKISFLNGIILFFLTLATTYQLYKLWPYLPFSKKEAKSLGKGSITDLTVLVSNVLDSNKRADLLLKHLEKLRPDVLLLMETNLWWEQQMENIEDSYPHHVKIPLENAYGMHLYSKFKLKNVAIHYKIQRKVPSITADLYLPSGEVISLFCLHPKPPSPTENETSINRDAELLMYAKEIEFLQKPTLVIGDLNDVAWSKTTRLFQQISGLLDPRKGRGFYSTYNAFIPFLRWPLDHVFYSDHFLLSKIARLSSIKSDHFPIFIALSFQPAFKAIHEKPEKATAEEQAWTQEKIDEGLKNGNSHEIAS